MAGAMPSVPRVVRVDVDAPAPVPQARHAALVAGVLARVGGVLAEHAATCLRAQETGVSCPSCLAIAQEAAVLETAAQFLPEVLADAYRWRYLHRRMSRSASMGDDGRVTHLFALTAERPLTADEITQFVDVAIAADASPIPQTPPHHG